MRIAVAVVGALCAGAVLAQDAPKGSAERGKKLFVDLNCYDAANHAAYLRKGEGKYFKSVAVGKAIELSGPGRTAAEQVLAGLIAGQ